MTQPTPNLDAPITWAQLLAAFNQAVEAGTVSPNSAAILRSALRTTLASLVNGPGGREVDRLTFEAVDLRPLLASAPAHARERAVRADNQRPGNAETRVWQALGAALPELFGDGPVSAAQRAALCGALWQPFFRALAGQPHETVHRHYLTLLSEGLRRHAGIEGPSQLPASADAGDVLMSAAGLDPKHSIPKAIHAYRVAVRALPDGELSAMGAPAWAEARVAKRHVRRLGHLTGTHEALLREQMPALADLLQAWREVAAPALRASSVAAFEAAVFRVAGLLVEMRAAGALGTIDLYTLRPLDLWDLSLPCTRPADSSNANRNVSAARDRLLADRLGSVAAAAAASEAVQSLPLAAAVAEWGEIARLVPRRQADGAQFNVGRGLVADMTNLWIMARSVYEPIIRANGSPKALADFVATQVRAQHVDEHFTQLRTSSGEPSAKDKRLAVRLCSTPILTCVVLPWWTVIELPRLARAREKESADHSRNPLVLHHARNARQAERAYISGLESWAIQAVGTADPLRRAQFVYGRVGREYSFDCQWGEDGTLLRVSSVTSHFSSFGMPGNQSARLKQDDIAERNWTMSQGILDHEWFKAYLRDAWLPRLRSRGLIGPDVTLQQAIESGQFSLFVSPKHGETTLWGGYSDGALSTRFARAFRTSLIALGYTIPRIGDHAAEGYGSILGPHILRLYVATYWLGLREFVPLRVTSHDGHAFDISGVEIAKRLTTDCESTLRKEYVLVSDETRALEREAPGSWRHPRAYDRFMDRTYMATDVVDWAAEWARPEFPLPEGIRREFLRQRRRTDAATLGAQPQRATRNTNSATRS